MLPSLINPLFPFYQCIHIIHVIPCPKITKEIKIKLAPNVVLMIRDRKKNFQLWALLWTCWKRKKHRGIEELQCFSNNLKRRRRCRIQLSIWWRGLISGEKRQKEECSYRNMWCMVVELMIYSLCWISFKEGMMELRNNPIVICYVIDRRMERGWQRSLWHECVYI